MILVDTSVWVDYMRAEDSGLQVLIEREELLCHPFVIGELAMGHIKNRHQFLADLYRFPSSPVAEEEEVLHFVNNHRLFGLGLSYIDAHLLAATKLTDEALLWTRDKRLHAAAERLNLAWTGSLLQ